MTQATRKSKNPPQQLPLFGNGQLSARLREGQLILLCALGLFLLASLATYAPTDPGWSHAALTAEIQNAGGHVGSWFADVSLLLFGYLAYILPIMVAYGGWTIYREWYSESALHHYLIFVRLMGFILVLFSGTALIQMHFSHGNPILPLGAGGALGIMISENLVHILSFQGSTLILLAMALIGITLSTGLSWLKLIDNLGRWLLWIWRNLVLYWQIAAKNIHAYYQQRKEQKAALAIAAAKAEPVIDTKPRAQRSAARIPRIIDIEGAIEEVPVKTEIAKPMIKFPKPTIKHIPKPITTSVLLNAESMELPDLDLLDLPPPQEQDQYTSQELEQMSREVESKLADFGVTATVVAVLPGPVITRFELDLAAGIKVSKITGLAKDLARSLSMISVRVVEVIPGKPYVGLELPNRNRQNVTLREVLSTEEYSKLQSPVALALGKDIAGRPAVVDLAKMPHLLVAGTTGAGKSVGVNCMLLSLLYKSTPEDVRLILIDPKMLELSVYEGIPHLLCPVVIDMKEAANALSWCVAEMERRYRLMATMGVRNMASYNRKVRDAIQKGEPIIDPLKAPLAAQYGQPVPHLEPFAYIVVVIDEFADMMMVVGKKVEELIARIAQKARAAGIHLILATQRPSVDVITGLIKANIPTRIAFQVASRIDSRTILDQQGAEQLLGRGDMLYLPAGAGVPVRIHGAFVADQEVHAVVSDWKKRGQPQYDETILQGVSLDSNAGMFSMNGDGEGEADPLYDQAVRIVTESRRASISNIQRRLKIGYNRAARLVEEMESAGIVSAMQNNGTREVLAAAAPSD